MNTRLLFYVKDIGMEIITALKKYSSLLDTVLKNSKKNKVTGLCSEIYRNPNYKEDLNSSGS